MGAIVNSDNARTGTRNRFSSQSQVEFLQRLSRDCINSPDNSLDSIVDSWLKKIGEYIQADYIYVDFNHLINKNYQWIAPEFTEIPRNKIKNIMEQSCVDQELLIPNLNQVSDGIGKELGQKGIAAIACLPIICERERIGYFGINWFEQALSTELEDFLQTLSNIFGCIFKRKLNSRELDKSQKLFKLNFQQSSIGMAILDTEGNFVKVNPALAEMLDYQSKELLDLNYRDITYEEDLGISQKMLEQALDNNRQKANYEKRYLTKNGQVIWVQLHVSIGYRQEKPAHLLIHVKDITDKKKASRELARKQQELEYSRIKSEFFTGLSHEFKTPLNMIFSTSQILEKHLEHNYGAEEDDRLEHYLELIRQNGYSLLRLVNNILDLSKIDVDKFNITLEDHNIVQIVDEIVKQVEDYIKEENRCFSYRSRVDSRIVACDPFSIERILLNLISNALKFTRKGDQISIDLYEEAKDSFVVIKVSDTGKGIKEEEQQYIFKHFWQPAKRKSNQGSGIGLAIVKSLVDLHEGNIKVESEPGVGSSFIIRFPIKSSRAERVEEKQNYFKQNYLVNKIDIELSDV